MVKSPSSPDDPPADFVPRIVLTPTPAAQVPNQLEDLRASREVAGPRVTTRTEAKRHVVVRTIAGGLGAAVEDLDRAIQLALADEPRGVVCDLSAVLEGAEPEAVRVLAAVGRHVREWPGMPVAVACPHVRVRDALRADPLGANLIVTTELLPAVSAVLATPTPVLMRLLLSPHPTASRASRAFVAQALTEWGLWSVLPAASVVISELVTNSTVHAGTDIAISVAWDRHSIRLTVRDRSPQQPIRRHALLEVHGRGLSIVAGFSRAMGVLPTADGGKVVWAVLDVPEQRDVDRPKVASTRSSA